MNQPEDRPPTGNRPGSSDDRPEQPRTPPEQSGFPGEARVDGGGPSGIPAPTLPPPAPPTPDHPAPAPDVQAPTRVTDAPGVTNVAKREAPPTTTSVPSVADRDDDLDDYDDDLEDDGDYEDEEPSRWAALLATVGTALVGIVSIQVIATVVEGLVLKRGERVGDIPEDVFHRLGYPFGGLGATALVFLVVGVVLLAMPSVLDEYLSPSQDRVVGPVLVVSVVMAVIVAIGSLLAVRANLHEYAAKGVAVPSYVRVQFTNFLLGSLGAAALALFTAIAAMNERGRARTT